MKRNQLLLVLLFSIPLSFFIQSYSNAPGGDHYRIYLNDKLVLEQFLYKNVEKTSLSLDEARATDKLVIEYSHCGKIGVGRVISLKDGNGKSLKAWKFTDSKAPGMPIMVKDLIPFIQKNGLASVYYTSQELDKGILLTNLTVKANSTARR